MYFFLSPHTARHSERSEGPCILCAPCAPCGFCIGLCIWPAAFSCGDLLCRLWRRRKKFMGRSTRPPGLVCIGEGPRSTDEGPRSTDDGPRSTDDGLWSTDDGRRSADGLLRYVPHGVIYSSHVLFFCGTTPRMRQDRQGDNIIRLRRLKSSKRFRVLENTSPEPPNKRNDVVILSSPANKYHRADEKISRDVSKGDQRGVLTQKLP